MTNVTTARSELEMNFIWAKNNPELFVTSVLEWAGKFPADWSHRVDFSRKGFLTLIAEPPVPVAPLYVVTAIGAGGEGASLSPTVFRGNDAKADAEAEVADLLGTDHQVTVYRGLAIPFKSSRTVTVSIAGGT